MTKRLCLKATLLLIALYVQPLYAQEAPPAAIAAPAPANSMTLPLPVAPSQLMPGQTAFPALPPSNPCKKPEEIRGFWRLIKTYETPQGSETKDLADKPHQYLFFAKDTTYRSLKLAQRVRGRQNFYNRFKRVEGEPAFQYVVSDSGFIFFYKDSVVIDTQACFIAAQDFGEFKKGNMLLLPPAPQAAQTASTRLLKVYKWFR